MPQMLPKTIKLITFRLKSDKTKSKIKSFEQLNELNLRYSHVIRE